MITINHKFVCYATLKYTPIYADNTKARNRDKSLSSGGIDIKIPHCK